MEKNVFRPIEFGIIRWYNFIANINTKVGKEK